MITVNGLDLSVRSISYDMSGSGTEPPASTVPGSGGKTKKPKKQKKPKK